MADTGEKHILPQEEETVAESVRNEGSEEDEDMGDEEEEEEGDSESSDDDMEESAIAELESKVSSNPYEYSVHIELIKLLKKLGELDRLRQANQRMSELFPLTSELWLDWINVEKDLIASPADREKVVELFERAVMDYVSPDLWLAYGMFCIGGIGTAEGIEKARNVFERALTTMGLHVTEGYTLWEVYREFENALLSNLQLQQGAKVTTEDKGLAEQMERVSTLFRRQLSVPLLDMEKTYEEYESWLDKPPPPNVKHSYDKAVAKLKKCHPYEQELMKTNTPSYEAYKAYLNHEKEKNEGNPARIQCLYERAVTDNCLQIELWKDYTKYLDSQLKMKSIVLPVYARAVRNCTWSFDLWQGYLLAMEKYEEPTSTITEMFEKALSAGFTSAPEYLQLWQTYIDYLRRRIDWDSENESQVLQWRLTMERADEYMASHFGEEGDPSCSIQQYWARMEAKHCHNMESARLLWNENMTLGHANKAQMWLEYYNLERAYGDNKHCRKILHRAAASVSDYPESIFETLVNFEREEGTLETLEDALKRVEIQMIRVNEMRAKRAQEVKKPDRNTKAVKRKHPDEQPKKAVSFIAAGDSEKPKNGEDVFKKPLPPSLSRSPIRSAGGQDTQTQPVVKKAKVEEQSNQTQFGVRWGPPPKEKPSHDSSKDHLTVFVKNLAYSVTASQIEDIFSECGTVSEVRVVQNHFQQSRGYCYVQFNDPSSVEKALKMDRRAVEGRPMYVDRSVDKTKTDTKKQFQFENKMEKNKLFVSGLPRSATEEQLQKLFGQYGKVACIRIITYRSGVPKGLAYIEYENESDAARAVMGADNTVMGEHTISVAISNPPVRKPKKGSEEERMEVKEKAYPPKSLGAKGAIGPRGKGRTQLSLVPRALQRPPTAKGQTPKKGPEEEGTKGVTDTESRAKTTVQMSNADFAKMLLKK